MDEKCYWGDFMGGTDDSISLVSFLADWGKEDIPLSAVFAGVGLDQLGEDFRQTTAPLEFTRSDGVVVDFHFAIDLITDLAVLLLECKRHGGINLHDLCPFDAPNRVVCIHAAPEEHARMNPVLRDFSAHPLAYDLSELVPQEDMEEMAAICESLRRELYGE